MGYLRNHVDAGDKIIDSRQAQRTFEDLESDRQEFVDEIANIEAEEGDEGAEDREERLQTARDSLAQWDRDNGDEYKALKAFCEEGADYNSDWRRGVACILESEFTAHIRENASEYVNVDLSVWPFNCIDWDEAADEKKSDYTEIDFDGHTYYVETN
jgi:hypothetical protein